MMFIVVGSRLREVTWYVGQDVPDLKPEDVVEIQADGHELAFVSCLFNVDGRITIPMTGKPVVRWYGDIARTIFLNLGK